MTVGTWVKEIKLKSGQVALIDAEDFEKVEPYNWYYNHSSPRLEYAFGRKKNSSVSKIPMHRLILDFPEDKSIDHINGNGLDNRKENLRICSHKMNMANQRVRSNNKSGFKGVHKQGEKWVASICSNYKINYLGIFNTPEEAASVYNNKAKELFGEFARINII